ncbi:hypothetical protein MRB53_040158 [Persea americana]|nr:hypothetical protein MRB53_040158 [Persea americana]
MHGKISSVAQICFAEMISDVARFGDEIRRSNLCRFWEYAILACKSITTRFVKSISRLLISKISTYCMAVERSGSLDRHSSYANLPHYHQVR